MRMKEVETLNSEMMSSLERELAFEAEAMTLGITAYRNRTQRLVEKGLETVNKYGKSMLARTIEPLSAAIVEFMQEAQTGPGRRHHALQFLSLVEPDVAALISAKVVLDGISQHR